MDFNNTHGQFKEQDVMGTEKRCNIMMQIGCHTGKNNKMSGISKLTTKTKNSRLCIKVWIGCPSLALHVLPYIERLKKSSTKRDFIKSCSDLLIPRNYQQIEIFYWNVVLQKHLNKIEKKKKKVTLSLSENAFSPSLLLIYIFKNTFGRLLFFVTNC
jgi:hypothetical protein